MYYITGVISVLNFLLSKLYSSSSGIAVLIACLDLVCLSLSLCPSREGREKGIYARWALV